MSPHNEGIHCVLTTKVTFLSVCFSCETSVLLRHVIFRGDWNKQNSKCNVFFPQEGESNRTAKQVQEKVDSEYVDKIWIKQDQLIRTVKEHLLSHAGSRPV